MRPPAQERQDWVDTARGIGIILVVYAHALRGQVTSGAFSPAWRANIQDEVIYAFHMPLFFFLAGLFVSQSLKRGTLAFLRDKSLTIIYPYFLWSVVSILLSAVSASAVNHPVPLRTIVTLWYAPVLQYWFLFALFVCQVIALFTRSDWRIISLLCCASAIGVRDGGNILLVAFNDYVYFGVGMLVSPYLQKHVASPLIWWVTAIVSTGLFAASFALPPAPGGRMLDIAQAALGIAATISIAILLASRIAWLTDLGRASMAIFVLHTIFSAGSRIAWHHFGNANDLAMLILGTVVGLAVPMAVWTIAARLGSVQVLGLGAPPRMKAAVG